MKKVVYLKERQVEALTGIKVATLRNHRCLGKGIPYSKVGAMVRYALDDVIDFMDSHRIAA